MLSEQFCHHVELSGTLDATARKRMGPLLAPLEVVGLRDTSIAFSSFQLPLQALHHREESPLVTNHGTEFSRYAERHDDQDDAEPRRR